MRRTILIAAVAILFHLPALWCPFISDDVALVAQNKSLNEPDYLPRAFTSDYGLAFGESVPKGYYRPVLLCLNYVLFHTVGPHPAPYRLLGLLLLVINALLIRRLLALSLSPSRRWLSTVGAAVYAAHPMRVEVTCFFMSLPDLLMESWVLLALTILTGLKDRPRFFAFGALARLAGLALVVLAATLTKESSFVLVSGVLAAVILVWGCRTQWRLLSGSGLAIGAGLLAGWLLRRSLGIPAPSSVESAIGLVTGQLLPWLAMAVSNVGRAIVPGPAVFYRDAGVALGSPLLLIPAAALAVGLLAALAWSARRMSLLAAAAWGWFGAAGVLQGLLMSGHLPYSDRHAAPAALIIGLVLLVDQGLNRMAPTGWLARRMNAVPVNTRLALVALYVAWLGAWCLAGSLTCTTSLAFFGAMAAANPDAAYPRICLAETMFHEYGDYEKMNYWTQEALRRSASPEIVRRAAVLTVTSKIVERDYESAVLEAERFDGSPGRNAEMASLKAVALAYLGKKTDAVQWIDEAIRRNPYERRYEIQKQRIQNGSLGPSSRTDPR